MEITIIFRASLRRYADGKKIMKMDARDGCSVEGVLAGLNTIKGEVGLILLNSHVVSQEAILKHNDTLEIFPLVDGG